MSTAVPPPLDSGSWLQRLGLGRPELRAWALYDWANSAFVTTVTAAVFPIYFSSVAAADLPPPVATARFALVTTIALAVVVSMAPSHRERKPTPRSRRKSIPFKTCYGSANHNGS